MKNWNTTGVWVLALGIITGSSLAAQEKQAEQKQGYQFTLEKRIPATPVEDQHRSGTCWSYATVSFIESELLRTGKGTHDLSEMFFVRQAYLAKAEKYVRMHGTINFAGGGLTHDVFQVWKLAGLVPEAAYDGLRTGDSLPVHGEMNAVLNGYIDQVIKNPNRQLTPVWKEGFEGILNAYLGEVPDRFVYQGITYTPRSFADGLGLDPDDYVMIGSFTHHPFYEDFIIEIPDNWSWGSIQNVPLDEMMQVLDQALENGFSVCWDADVGEKGFDWKSGIALIPSEDIEDLSGLERARWDELSESERNALFYDFSAPKTEKKITQQVRQEAFDNYKTTDDHLMHITGLARDQVGNRFYLVKNSWGTGNHIYDGYMYASEAYMRAKTIFLVVHRDAVPRIIAERLGL
ncbi:MAG TPA: aminopeptidase [Bacteroides sp.]|nr:aminopeptidase [Bacteroides sp.]